MLFLEVPRTTSSNRSQDLCRVRSPNRPARLTLSKYWFLLLISILAMRGRILKRKSRMLLTTNYYGLRSCEGWVSEWQSHRSTLSNKCADHYCSLRLQCSWQKRKLPWTPLSFSTGMPCERQLEKRHTMIDYAIQMHRCVTLRQKAQLTRP